MKDIGLAGRFDKAIKRNKIKLEKKLPPYFKELENNAWNDKHIIRNPDSFNPKQVK